MLCEKSKTEYGTYAEALYMLNMCPLTTHFSCIKVTACAGGMMQLSAAASAAGGIDYDSCLAAIA